MYMRFGRECPQYLDGMFAFAVVDLDEKTLFLARDRFGEKPLYVLQVPGTVAFASEISALRKLLPDSLWDVDPISLAIYHVVCSIPAPRTIYKNVHSLRPAHWMEVDSIGGIREGSYWSLEGAAAAHANASILSYGDAAERCQHLLLRATRSRMVSDVPVGVFLSGGLDSGSILSLLTAQGYASLDALCIDFPDERFSDYRLAEATAKAFGARLHRRVVTPESFMEHLNDFFSISDQPTMDGFNTYFVSMHARALNIKVWLSGVGGDELFGGYPSFQRIGRIRRLSRLLQMTLPDAVADTWTRFFPHHLKISRLLHLSLKGDPVKRAYQGLRNPVPRSNMLRGLSDTLVIHEGDFMGVLDSLYPSTAYCRDDFQRASAIEAGVYMAAQLLRDIDNFSMAHSIETRAPFLDHELFGFVFSLPQRLKTRQGGKKPLLTDALANPLPEMVVRQPKRGFTFPLEIWLKGHMDKSFRDHVLTERNCEFWDTNVLERMWSGYLKGELHWSVPWGYYAFARWWEAHRE
jgi:asparagine synthase (glutamine-hydrolysing)